MLDGREGARFRHRPTLNGTWWQPSSEGAPAEAPAQIVPADVAAAFAKAPRKDDSLEGLGIEDTNTSASKTLLEFVIDICNQVTCAALLCCLVLCYLVLCYLILCYLILCWWM